MSVFCVVFLLRLLQICAGCAGTCAGFVQGLEFEKSLENNALKRLVQGVHGLEKIPLCVRAGAGARVCQCARMETCQKPCTPCTDRFNLLKKREKVIFKPCTNPALTLHITLHTLHKAEKSESWQEFRKSWIG